MHTMMMMHEGALYMRGPGQEWYLMEGGHKGRCIMLNDCACGFPLTYINEGGLRYHLEGTCAAIKKAVTLMSTHRMITGKLPDRVEVGTLVVNRFTNS